MRTEHAPNTIYLKDYQAPDFAIESLALNFNLHEHETLVTATAQYVRTHHNNSALVLNGELLKLISVSVNGETLEPSQYAVDSETLSIPNLPAQFELVIVTQIDPKNNKALEGLYQSSGNFCTQCEAQGFRKITYYLDRPDVMTVFTTRLEADQAKYPVLLSNGNLIEQGQLANGRHFAVWHDPFRKPSYLFALVAGHLQHVKDTFTTSSGRNVDLYIYTEAHNIDKCGHAMASLKRAMKWDEERFGLEYDLDIYMIVAVDDFNMGAMENKGLNIFNSKMILANSLISTDKDFLDIEATIAHEYFHNWTGNRVTCRDWFQLGLKEGLTVFREQEFIADGYSKLSKRIDDVKLIKSSQFVQDNGFMSQSVQPESYIDVNNIYTTTTYEKGAEIIRICQAIMGKDDFSLGLVSFLKAYDGQAVTIDEFLDELSKISKIDLKSVLPWFRKKGTPVITLLIKYEEDRKNCIVSFIQKINDQSLPFAVPIELALLSSEGKEVFSKSLVLTEATTSIVIPNLNREVIPSLRGFSAPVHINYSYSNSELATLMKNDADIFNRWHIGQAFGEKVLLELVKDYDNNHVLGVDYLFIDSLHMCMTDESIDYGVRARFFELPSFNQLVLLVHNAADPLIIAESISFLEDTIAKSLYFEFEVAYNKLCFKQPYVLDYENISIRKFKNMCLRYLSKMSSFDIGNVCLRQYKESNNYNDCLAAMEVLNNIDCKERDIVFNDFLYKTRSNPLLLNTWFSLEARCRLPRALDNIKRIIKNSLFDIHNPNHINSLFVNFARYNLENFHNKSGSSYDFLFEQVINIDKFNPFMATQLLRTLDLWYLFDMNRKLKIHDFFSSLAKEKFISRSLRELIEVNLNIE